MAPLALIAGLIFDLVGRYSANAKSRLNSSLTSISSAVTTQTTTLTMPKVNIYALTTDNQIYVLKPDPLSYALVGRVPRTNGDLIGLDFRPADGGLYAVTDTGKVLLINLATSPLGVTVASTLSPRFAGGFQSLMDFNPVVNALRLIGSNDQNFALVNSNGGNLNVTAVQTKMTYAANDVNTGVDPNICAGAYTNNVAGAANTIFYGIDYDLDTFVTIAPPLSATGSSNTGGGILQTIGSLVDPFGKPINVNPTVDIDIYTDSTGNNFLVGIDNQTIFTIGLGQINKTLALGTTQNVVVPGIRLPATPSGDSFTDVAISVDAPAPAPAPTPTPSPTPANAARCTVKYAVSSQWDVGFVANFLIQNNTGVSFNGWNLTFTFTGNQAISNLWNGSVLQRGQSVRVTNATYNANFANNSTVSFGFQASYSGTNGNPFNFALNGIPCTRR